MMFEKIFTCKSLKTMRLQSDRKKSLTNVCVFEMMFALKVKEVDHSHILVASQKASR